ncbi:dTDP-4-dehydrorhamnose 3,5-epimerase [Alphaproteobacteria bacterium]|nr:dTDP-4-dehydrorhamnose 3,5-epimerase [Alphaproteobacteria bacterium]MDC1121581.1 dTDP-4-dehydrorhamnose 3,5-epimerase family protein [Alphaproteobacteria bacterium]
MEIVIVDVSELEKFGLSVSTISKHSDARGDLSVFFEIGSSSTEDVFVITKKRSLSKPGVFRGLHIQTSPYRQRKISKVIEGEIFQAFLDLDVNSPYFGQTILARVSSQHDVTVSIPYHFAHGFFAPTGAEFEYICVGAYSEEHEISIAPNFLGFDMTLSDKDANGFSVESIIASIRSGRFLI